jgi:hypothetical protein
MYDMLVEDHKPVIANFGDPKNEVRRNRHWIVRNDVSLNVQGIHGMRGADCSGGKNRYCRLDLLPIKPDRATFLAESHYRRRVKVGLGKEVEAEAGHGLRNIIGAPHRVKNKSPPQGRTITPTRRIVGPQAAGAHGILSESR